MINHVRVKRRVGMVALVSLLSSAGALGEPSPTTAYLMNEPASLMDLGLMRLGNWLEDAKRVVHYNGQEPVTTAYYSWDENRIVINVAYNQLQTATLPAEAVTFCRNTVNTIRELTTPESYFGHAGYAQKNEPERLAEEIRKLTIIRVAFYYDYKKTESGLAPGQQLYCTGTFNNDDVAVVAGKR